MAQSVEHIVHIDGVTGSSPVATTISKSGKLLAGLFLSASSFTPMEVQSCRPLCGIQADLNGSSPVWSAILEKSELNPDWGWVRISSFYLKYCGVINKTNERRRIGIIPIVATSTL